MSINGKDEKFTFTSSEDYQTIWYLFSHNRPLDQTERLGRITGRYPSVPEIKQFYEEIVVRRQPPSARNATRNVDMQLML
eukprot:UN32436